jgi:transposase
LNSPDSVGNDRDIAPGQRARFGDSGINAHLAVRGRGQAPQPRSGASKAPGLRSATHRETIKAAARRPQNLTLPDRSSADLYTAWRIKENLRWIRKAQSVQAARWRITNFLRHARERLGPEPILDPVRKALATVETHSSRILQRWTSSHSNARLEGLNGLFQAARARARGYRNVTTFATIIYLIAAPLGDLVEST